MLFQHLISFMYLYYSDISKIIFVDWTDRLVTVLGFDWSSEGASCGTNYQN